MGEIIVKTPIRNFKVKFAGNFSFIYELKKIPYFVVVTESVVFKLYQKEIFDKLPKDRIIVLNFEEKNKTLDTAIKICQKLLKIDAKRNLHLISIGGGVTQDVTGFVASILYRGINWVYVPTTLLAMTDSSIGLKTSLNFNNFKNVLGTFYPPSQIFIVPAFLKTLRKKDYYSGVGEIIKFFLMKRNALKNIENSAKKIEKLNKKDNTKFITDVIKESLKIKIGYMKGDEFDLGRRNLLNYGHEIGHALESTSHFIIPHGIAITLGIIFANMVSLKKGFLDRKNFEIINEKLIFPMINYTDLNLKKEYFNEKLLIKNIKKDKKRINENLSLIIPGHGFKLIKIVDFTGEEFRQTLSDFLKILNPYFK